MGYRSYDIDATERTRLGSRNREFNGGKVVRVESDGGRRYIYIYIYSNYPGSGRGRRTMTRRQTRWYRCLAHRPSPPSVRRTLVFFCDLQLFLSNYRGELDGHGKLIMPQSGRAVAQNKNARLRATPLGQIKSARSAQPFESFLRHHRRHYVFLPFFLLFLVFRCRQDRGERN